MDDSDDDSAMREMMGFSSFGSNKRKKLNTGAVSSLPPSKFLRPDATDSLGGLALHLTKSGLGQIAACALLHTHCDHDSVVNAYPECERRLPAITIPFAYRDLATILDCKKVLMKLEFHGVYKLYPAHRPSSSSAVRIPLPAPPNSPLFWR